MKMFSYYEHDSLLHRMNPAVKLAAVGLCLILLTVVFDPFVPLVLLVGITVAARLAGGVPPLAMVKGLLPFTVLAFGFFWMQVVFPRGDAGDYTLATQVGSVPIYLETVLRGAALGLRVLCYAAFALLFVATTDPTRLVLSLMQHARLSPRFGYSLLAAYRFFPLYHSEFMILRAAHQVRGAEEGQGLRGRVGRLRRYAIPLLAGAVRRAERVAIAMEARGFPGKTPRHYYTAVPIGAGDWLLGASLVAMTVGTALVAHRLGLLQLWDGSLYF
ncbi:MAG: energy-coupling factor transporter transmembrane component T [Thermaerobacterales bacterium]